MDENIRQKLQEAGVPIDLLEKLDIHANLPVVEELRAIRNALEAIVQKEEPKEERPEVQKVSFDGIDVVTLKGDKGEQGEKGDKGDKGEDGKDGKDGRNGVDGLNGLDGRDGVDGKNGENGKDGSPDTPEQIVEKLESLEGDNRLDKSAIKGLDEELKKVESKIKPEGGVRRVFQPYVDDLSGSTDGVNKTFYLSRAPLKAGAVMVYGTDFPVILRPTIDFTLADKTLTLTSAVPAPTQGATLMCSYFA